MKRKSIGQWKVQALLKHQGKFYDYSLLDPSTKAGDRVNVICPLHGVFNIGLNEHVYRGSICPVCSKQNESRLKTTPIQNRILKAREQHGDKYDFSHWPEGAKKHDKVKTICPMHGAWYSTIGSVACLGRGCPKCNGTPRQSREDRIKQAKMIHGDKYDYSRVPNKVTAYTVFDLGCPVHGWVKHTMNRHVNRGLGCRHCSSTGFQDNKKGYLYLLRSDTSYIKIGISNKVVFRIKQLKHETPFDFDTLAVFSHPDGSEVRKLEKWLHDVYPSAGMKGFDGATEWRVVPTLDILMIPELFGFKQENPH